MPFRVALKVDCDTADGTRRGIPRLLSLFEKKQIRATFFFSLGPDRSGRAALRVFTRKGFLKKMFRSRAPSLYPLRTMLSGTLLPAPMIGKNGRAEIRSVAAAGHETGVHAWDHVGWHDGLPRWSAERIADEYRRLHAEYREIFGAAARASACPGWTVSDAYLAEREKYPLLYTSDTREGSPFFPRTPEFVSAIPEIPSTLPTLDEKLGDPDLPGADALRGYFADAPRGDAVHTIHTEVEGGPYLEWFARLVDDWKDRGARFVPMETFAIEARERAAELPVRRIVPIRLPGRGGVVSSGYPPH
ncbi:MAG TPA: polysaccharide deacetylase family protein [Thermoanaerobaculia bacterium]|nr:polysaccharide deacetylase family protein [Thermoanaerobaculia bacterium]